MLYVALGFVVGAVFVVICFWLAELYRPHYSGFWWHDANTTAAMQEQLHAKAAAIEGGAAMNVVTIEDWVEHLHRGESEGWGRPGDLGRTQVLAAAVARWTILDEEPPIDAATVERVLRAIERCAYFKEA